MKSCWIRNIKYCLLTVMTLAGGYASAQMNPRPHIENIRLDVVDNKVLIHYDIMNTTRGETHLVDLKFLTRDLDFFHPMSLSGDVGEDVAGGPGKVIIWDISEDMTSINTKMKPGIYLDGFRTVSESGGGPSNAFLSLLVPGLGDYYVADPAHMRIKPWMRTAAALGMVGLGVYSGHRRYREPGYQEKVWVREWTRGELSPYGYQYFHYVNVEKEVWVEGDVKYWLFKGDKETFLAAGAAIWLFDVLWVTNRGITNNKLKQSLGNSGYQLGYIPEGLEIKYTLRF